VDRSQRPMPRIFRCRDRDSGTRCLISRVVAAAERPDFEILAGQDPEPGTQVDASSGTQVDTSLLSRATRSEMPGWVVRLGTLPGDHGGQVTVPASSGDRPGSVAVESGAMSPQGYCSYTDSDCEMSHGNHPAT
jgi:hypothetical protein